MHSKSESISNKPLRKNNLESFLHRFGVRDEVRFLGRNYHFKKGSLQEAEELVMQLTSALELGATEAILFIEDLIIEAINAAPCESLPKLCCAPLFSREFDYLMDDETGTVRIRLPDVAYGPMLVLLHSPYLKIEKDALHFDLQQFLENREAGCFVLTDKKAKMTDVLLKSTSLEKKRIFYVRNEIDENHIEVTPYFCVPFAPTPPNYHFVLDVSGSMFSELSTLKESAIRLAQSLFDFQPGAILSLKTFASEIRAFGQYRIHDLPRLESILRGLVADGSTCLNKANRETVEQFQQLNDHNNVLLFTDGSDTNDNGSEGRLLNSYTSDERNETPYAYRNKLFIVSFNTEQGLLMKRIAQFFRSPIINTKSADFYQVLSDKELLGHWAAARELFTARIEIRQDAEEIGFEQYSLPCDLSGQFMPLKSKRLSYNGTLKIEILNGEGKAMVQTEETFAKPGGALVSSPSSSSSSSSSLGDMYNSFGLLGLGSASGGNEPTSSASTEFTPH